MEENMELNMKDLSKTLLKRFWIIVLCAVLVGSAVLVYTVNFVTPMYEASVTLYVNNNTAESNKVISSDLAVALQLVNTYVKIIESDAVLENVIAQNGLNLTAKDIRDMLSAESVDDTEMFRVKITSPNPQMSADIANAIADVAPAEISKIIEGSSAKVIDHAKVPATRSSPNYITNTIMGIMTGGLLAMLAIVLSLCMDKRVKNEEDLMKIFEAPVLGEIPDFTQISKDEEKMGVRKS